MTKHETFSALITMLCEGFGRPPTAGLLELYWIVFKDLGESEMKAAIGRAAAECKFMPSPAELRGFVRAPRDLVAEAQIAWGAVRKAVDKIDYTVSQIDFGPHVNAVVRQLGGWDALCRAPLTDLDVWKRKEFERLYLVFGEKEIGDIGLPLEGPLDGKKYKARVVAIPGIPSQPVPALPAVWASESVAKSLADAKS